MALKNEPSSLTEHNFKSMQEITTCSEPNDGGLETKFLLISPPKSSNLSVTSPTNR